MVKFHSIKIKNYRSIKEAVLNYESGVWHIIGTNNDNSGFKSNGSGKTTVLLALQQCLFNRTTFGSNIEDTYHLLKYGYSLQTTFTIKSSLKGKRTFRITNEREPLRILIEELVNEEYEDFGVKSIPQALAVIQDIIGMDFNTFVATTYISHSTVVNLIENFTSSTLIKSVLDFDSIYSIDKAVKRKLQEQIQISTTAQVELKNRNETLKVLDSFTYVDLDSINTELEICTTKLLHIDQSVNALRLEQLTLEKVNIELAIPVLHQEVSKAQKQLDTNICPCCNQDIIVDVENLSQNIETYTQRLISMEVRLTNIDNAINKLEELLSNERTAVYKDINHYETQLTIGTYKNEQHKLHSASAKNIRAEVIKLEAELKDSLAEQEILVAINNSIKSGAPLKSLIVSFCTALNLYIQQYTSLLSITYALIKAVPKKNTIDLVAIDTRFNKTLNLTDYSGGELTRIRIVLLMSVLNAIKTLTGVSTNILIFDEALDTLDVSAAQDLGVLFEYLANHEDKFIALVSHGKQLNAITFNGDITITKNDGISTITQI